MSRFRDGLVSRKGFAPLPKIGDDVPGLVQPRGSLDGSTSSCDSGISSRYIPLLEEGDLITGTVSITHDRICMLPAIRDGGHVAEERALEEHILSLQIIPPAYREDWTLEHGSNKTWMSANLQPLYDTYATFLIAPSAEDSRLICGRIERDNLRRSEYMLAHGQDPGRAPDVDWFEGTRGEYELVVLHPDYFSIHNSGVVIKHPVTQDFQIFYCSQYKDGHLREGSPTGPILPPLCSRGKINRLIPLNPILVNYAAVIRFKCLIRRDSTWKSLLSPYVVEILRGVAELHEAINWKPNQPTAPETTSGRTDQDWPYDLALGGAPQPSPSAPDPNQGIETALDRAFALLEAGFVDPADLYDELLRPRGDEF